MPSPRVEVLCPGQGTWQLAPGERLRLGRRADNEVVLPDSSVSRYHAELRWDPDEDRPYVMDMDSANGVRVDGVLVQGRSYLTCSATRLEVGEVLLSVDLLSSQVRSASKSRAQVEAPDREPAPAMTGPEAAAPEAAEPEPAAAPEAAEPEPEAAPEADAPTEANAGLPLEDDELELQEDEDRRQASKEERELVAALALAVKAQRQYPADHPVSKERSGELLDQLNGYLLLNTTGALLILREDQVEINGRRIKGSGLGRARMQDFMTLLQGTGLAGIALRGRFDEASLNAMLQMFVPTGAATTPEERYAELEAQAASIEDPADVRVLDPRQVRELTYRSDDANLTEEELALFYYSRLMASVEASHLAVQHGRSPDFHVRQVRTSLTKTIEFLREGLFEQRLMALTAVPPPEGAELAAHATNVCILAMGAGRRLGLGRGGLANLGFAALYHKLGQAEDGDEAEPGSAGGAKRAVIRGVSCALRTRGFGDAGLSRLIVAHEHLRKTERFPRSPGLPSPHPFSLIVGVVSAFVEACRPLGTTEPVSPAAALEQLEANPRRYDPTVVGLLRELLGAVPRGTFLRTADGRIAVTLDGGRHGRPIARVVLRSNGDPDPRGTLLTLSTDELAGAELLDPREVDAAWWKALLR